MNWYLTALRRYAEFHGRARRSEYWYFTLFNILIFMGLSIVGAILGPDTGVLTNLLVLVYSLVVLVPGIAVCIRRLHDTGRSGWWWFIAIIPFVGAVVLLVFLVQDSQPGVNAYGANPKAGLA